MFHCDQYARHCLNRPVPLEDLQEIEFTVAGTRVRRLAEIQ
jgi:hypothetical protein